MPLRVEASRLEVVLHPIGDVLGARPHEAQPRPSAGITTTSSLLSMCCLMPFRSSADVIEVLMKKLLFRGFVRVPNDFRYSISFA